MALTSAASNGGPAGVYGWSGTRSRKPLRASSKLVPSFAELMSPSFVSVDFETANRLGGVSACQIALVKVVDGNVVARQSSYLCPPVGYDRFEFTWLHGISQKQTSDAPAWDEASSDIAEFVGDSPVYAHNASFDARVWRELDNYFDTETLPDRFYCSYRLAQRTVPGLVNYKLPTVAHACAPWFELDHHQADSDAEACALIVASIQAMSGVDSLLSS
ncbi:exonuclease domain-containing protein [Actinomycetaceae bacterium MB13-C1-2]|nr:exonuclease domain-containing protein [Actinomycetaceae bacterium MB13-C1-2]